MRTAQDIAFGVTGQTLELEAPQGRPTSITSVTVYAWDAADDGTTELATTGSAAIDAVSTTIASSSGHGQTDARVLNVTSGIGIGVGRAYLVTAANGASERIEVAAATGTTVTARHPLHNAYAAAATFVSCRATIGIDSTWVADENNLDDSPGGGDAYRVRWVYVVGGLTYVHDTYFNLERYPGVSAVQPVDVDAILPGWLDSLPTDHRIDQGRRLISEAHRAVRMDLIALGIDDAAIASGEVLDGLVRRRVVALGEMARYLSNASGDDGRFRVAQAHYAELLDSTVRIAANAAQRDKTGAATTRSPLPFTRR